MISNNVYHYGKGKILSSPICYRSRAYIGLITCNSIHPKSIIKNLLMGYLWLFNEPQCLWLTSMVENSSIGY